jgi:glutamate racemase
MPKTKIGVFDSGVGGLSVANAIKKALPECEILYKDDSEHVPYGTKTT